VILDGTLKGEDVDTESEIKFDWKLNISAEKTTKTNTLIIKVSEKAKTTNQIDFDSDFHAKTSRKVWGKN